MEFRILGSLEVLDEGRKLPLGPAKERAVLGVLLLHAGSVVSRTQLIEGIWGETPPPTAAKAINVYVSQVRRTLSRNGGDPIVTRSPGYVVDLDEEALDATRFQRLATAAREREHAGELEAAAALMREGLGLWRGPALAGLELEGSALNDVARLEDLRLTAELDLVDYQLALGEHELLVAELERLVAQHPFDERLRGQLILALYRSGRQADALRAYRETRETLIESLGIEPGVPLQRLERGILNHDPSLEAPAGVADGQTIHAGATTQQRSRRRPWIIVSVAALVTATAGAAAVLVAVGRGGSGGTSVPANSLAVIDPGSKRVVGAVPVGARPEALAFGSGALWVANLDDGTVQHVDPATERVVRTIPVGPRLAVITGGAGRLWVASGAAHNTAVSIRSIDPRYDELSDPMLVHGSRYVDPKLAVGDRRIWLATGSELAGVDPRTHRITRIDTGSGPSAVAFGFGAIWVADFEANNLVRVDAATKLSTTIPVGRSPDDIAVGEGSVWVTESLDGTVRRIDPDTNSVLAVIPVGSSPRGVAVGDNAVWVANGADGTVSVIDPRQNKVEKTIHVGGHPAGVAIGAGKIWISVQPDVREAAAGGGGRLRIENRYDVDSLDPALASTTSSWAIEYATCAKLLNYPDEPAPRGTKLVPEVAQALPARSPDGKTYTITIRRGFRFSPPSNAPVTAETFKETIERSLDPRMRSPASYFVQDIVGEAAFVKGNAKHIAGVTATGNHLTIRLTDVSADFPTRISLPFFCAVPQGTPVDPRGLRLIPSAGPYYVASYVPGAGILLKRNPNYRGGRPRRFRQISMKTGVAEGQAVADARTGRADWVYHLSREQAAGLAHRYGPRSDAAAAGHQQLFASPELVVDFLAMNTSRGLFKDVRLRKAVNYAIDRHALAPYGYVSDSGSGLPIGQYLPPGIPGFRRLDVYPPTPDLSKARRLARGHGGEAVLYACSRPTCVHLAQIVKANLRAIGIDVTIKTGSSGWLYSRLGRRGEPYDLAIAAWVADYPDPADFLNNMLSGGQLASGGASTNFARFDAAAINRRLDEAAALTGADRYRAYARLDADLTRHLVPWAPFATDSDQDFFSARIGCQLDQPIYGIDLGALCVATHHP